MSQLISNLSPGSLVKLNENGVPKKFIFLEHDHYGKGEVTLLRKDTFAPRQWTSSFDASYNNAYNGCDMDMFCNTQYPTILDPIIRACLVDVPIPVARGAICGDVDGTVVDLSRKCFLLSAKEATNSDGYKVEGTSFSYLATVANRIAYHDETTTAESWWLRSPSSGGNRAYYVFTSGTLEYDFVYYAKYDCPRPALALKSGILVSDAVDSDGCYVVVDCPAAEGYQKIDGIWRHMV